MMSKISESYTLPAARSKLQWLKEVVLVVAFYLIYTYIRNRFGTSTTAAFNNAKSLIQIEENLGLYVEGDVQGWFRTDIVFLRFWNAYYGITHFLVTIAAFIWAYVRFPGDFPKIRNMGLWGTGLGLITFASFPVMPPRLLGKTPDESVYGGAHLIGENDNFFTDFDDTIREHGGFLSFESEAVESISNQYAAMPSIHILWAIWCAYIFYPRVRSPILKALALLYPFITLFAVIVTANHYWVDAVGGAIFFVIAYFVATRLLPKIMPKIKNRLKMLVPSRQ